MDKISRYHLQKSEDVLTAFRSGTRGLSSLNAKNRLLESGYNELPEVRRDSYPSIFFRQFKSSLIYILLISGIVVFLMGEVMDAGVILVVLLFNATVGAVQEGKAQNTFLALKKFIKGRASVLRDGDEIVVADREIVPGDIIILREGEKVPADARLIVSNSLKINEAALTGESIPSFKTITISKDKVASPINQENMVYNGTVVVSGNGKAVVVATGTDTFLGGIAKETLDIDSDFPLKNDIKKLSRMVIFFVLAVCVALFILGMINGHALRDIFKTMVAVSVSVIPEGLPIVITLVLAGGVWRMSKNNVLVKKLQAVEVLGETNVLAVDKTGTVTKNELVVEEVYVGNNFFEVESKGYYPKGEVSLAGKTVDPLNHPELLMAGKIAALNSSANLIFEKNKRSWKIAGDPTEGSIAVFSKKIGFHRDELLSETPLLDEMPFDYELKFHGSLHAQEGKNFLAIIGSPEAVLTLAKKEWHNDGAKKITKDRRKAIQSVMDTMSQKGLRVIGFSFCETSADKIDKENIPQLIFGGFFGIKDALREEVKDSVRQVVSSGIKMVMITGDHEITAKAVAKEAGIHKLGDVVLGGEEIGEMDEKQLATKIRNVSVFSRITPDQKLRIIKAYQANGMVIAMTGDGVNDALSLTAADIGISMGKIGTEVAKEASDIILLDDNFGSITHGVAEGRNIFKNIKKVILYLFSTSAGELLTIIGALVIGFPLPILPAQILWLNLVTDGFLDVSLAMEPRESGSLKRRAQSDKKGLLDKLMAQRMFWMALPMAIGTLLIFKRFYEDDLTKAWTMSLTTLAVFQWFNAWNCRSERKSIFKMKFFSNRFLFGATVIVIILQLSAVYIPFFQKILKTVPLDIRDWLLIIPVAFSIVLVEETRKFFFRKNMKNITHKSVR